MSINTDRVTPLKLKVEEWLEKEGYSLEFLVATAFEKQGFIVSQGENFRDDKHDINREVDVCAADLLKFNDTNFRISHVLECKWSKDKPWVVFCSKASERPPEHCISQTMGSLLGEALLWDMATDEAIFDNSHFLSPEAPGFSGRQAFSNGKDLFYSSMQNITSIANLKAEYYDNEPGTQFLQMPDFAEIVLPVIVVNGTLYQAIYNEDIEKIELEETNHIRLFWEGSDVKEFCSSVDIITSEYVDEFARIRKKESKEIFLSMEKSLRRIQKCYKQKNLDSLENKVISRGYIGLPKFLYAIENYTY